MNIYLQNTCAFAKVKNLFMVLFFIFISFNAASQGFTLDATGVPFKFLNTNRTTVAGTLGNAGSAALYSNIATIDGQVIDGKITVVSLSNASISTFDSDTGGTDSNRFQPVYSTTTSAGGFISYKLEFFDQATGVPVYINNFFFNGIDLDSGGTNQASDTEVFQLTTSEFESYTVNNPTQLLVSTVATNTQFRGNPNNLGGITFEDTSSFYARYTGSRTFITFRIGGNGPLANRLTAVNLGVAGVFTNPATFTNTSDVNDLQITKTVDIGVAPVNTVVTFTLTARNNGPGSATGVTVNDKIPSGFTIGTVSPPNGTTYDATTGIWTIGTLSNNVSRVLTIPATVKATGVYKNDAGIAGNQTESNAANNNASATVTYCTAPVISSQPTTIQSACLNTSAQLSVTATGSGTLVYQWYRNATNSNTGGTSIALATAASYAPPTTSVGTNYYYVTVRGTALCGTTTSTVARVDVNAATVISAQPSPSQTVCQNTGATAVTMTATGTGVLTYNLYINTTNANTGGTLIGSGTTPSFVPPTDTAGIFYYYVIITSNCAAVASNVFTITVNPCLVAVADTFSANATQGINGVNNVVNVLTNDTFNGVAATTTNVAVTVNTAATSINGGPVPTLNTSTGGVSIPANTPAGTYTINYRICPNGSTNNCASANVSITVATPAIDAVTETLNTTSIGGTTASVLANDTYNGGVAGSATTANVNLTAVGTYPTGITLNTDGTITIAAGTAPASYSIQYKICDKINPNNCDTVATTVVVAPSIDAVADAFSATATQAIAGATTVGNVLTNDKVNGIAATTTNATITLDTAAVPAYSGALVPMLSTSTGVISIPMGTPAGVYTIKYKICGSVATSTCDTDTATITVATPAIDAVTETLNTTSTGGTTASVLANDTYNGGSATTANVNLTAVGTYPTGITLNTDGTITIAAGTAPASYSIQYKICDKINPSNCDTVTTTVVVAPSIDAVADAFSATASQAIAGATTVGNVLTNDKVNGIAATTANATITLDTAAVPAYTNAPVPTLSTSTGIISIPTGTPAGIYTIKYKICGSVATSTCDTDTATITVATPAIDAVTETLNTTSTGGTTASVLANDTYNGGVAGSATTANVNLTAVGTYPTGITLNTDGTITIAAGTAPASYSIQYKICDKINPSNCDTVATTVVIAPSIDAVADAFSATASQAIAGSTTVGNVLTNDKVNGIAATTANATITLDTAAVPAYSGAPVPTLSTSTGEISIPTGTPAGIYTIKYKICGSVATSTCDTDTATITVATPAIDAVTETLNTTSTGGTTASVLANDTYNGGVAGSATTANVNLTAVGTYPTGITLNTDGTITIAAGTAPASYSIQYKICDKINPNNCDTVTTTVVVAPSIDAVADAFSATATQAIAGATTVGNVLTNDKVNGIAATTANATITLDTAAVPEYSGAPVPTLSASTGIISIPTGTPAGVYTIKYKICGSVATTTCDIDTATITVATPVIDAVADSFTLLGDGSSTTSLLVNDSYNDGIEGSATTTNVNLTKVGTWPAGFTLNEDGTITVESGTVSGNYALEYKICDKINPNNCDNAIATISITACYLPGSIDANAGSSLNTSVGISSLNRTGVSSTWPGVRKSGWIVLEAKTKGFVLNRVKFNASSQPVADDGITLVITNPIEGMMVFDTTNNCMKVYTTTNGINFAWYCMETQTCPE